MGRGGLRDEIGPGKWPLDGIGRGGLRNESGPGK